MAAEGSLELRQVFLRELAAGFERAREAHERLLLDPLDGKALAEVRDFFHRIAGTAGAVGLPLLGALASICETLVEVSGPSVRATSERAVEQFADGLAGVAALLEANPPSESKPGLDVGISTVGLLQPSAFGKERTLAKILIVDDDVVSAKMTDSCLRAAGFMSLYCSQPERALHVIQTELPDLIILDVVMPGIDGFDLCMRVRSHPAMQLTPILFLTRKGEVEQRVRGLEVGGNDYMAKPFEPQELIARVRSHLHRLAALRDLAIRDGLTGCYNHKYFKARLKEELSVYERYKSPLTLGMLDIDAFKAINDRHGHLSGDAVLSHLANLTVSSLRSTDVVARYGGEEFALLFLRAGQAEARIVANRMRERIAQNRFSVPAGGADALEIPVTVSIGLAEAASKDTAQTLIERADAALYKAKASGKNRICVYAHEAT